MQAGRILGAYVFLVIMAIYGFHVQQQNTVHLTNNQKQLLKVSSQACSDAKELLQYNATLESNAARGDAKAARQFAAYKEYAMASIVHKRSVGHLANAKHWASLEPQTCELPAH